MKTICILLFAATIAFAGKGSLYSRYGVGEINTFISGKNTGMGNTGLALFGETHINLLNPASTAYITRTILSASYQYRNFTSEETAGSSVFGSGNISSFALAFPVYAPKKMVITFGLLPFSSVSYEQENTQIVAGNLVTQSFDGRGGITSGQLGLSYEYNSDLMLGVTTHYLFGTIYRDQTITFLTGNIFGGSFNNTASLSGFGLTLGGIYTGIDKALGFSETKKMNLGVTLFTGSSLNYSDQTLQNFPTNQDTISILNKTMKLPIGLAVGLAYMNEKTVYTTDLHFQNWGNFTVAGVHPTEIQNSFRLGAGVEFLPASEFVSDEFYKRISYRFGGYFHATNLKINGTSINEIFASTGVSFPMSLETRVHLGLEYGIRGTTSASLIKDSMVRFTVSVSASELMFIQPPIE